MAGARTWGTAGTVPFWAHQFAEMLLAGLLLLEGARTGQHTAVLVGMGGALLLLSLCSDGALGAWPRIGRRLHRVLDLAAAGILAVTPLLLPLDGVLAIAVLEAAALGMVWLALRTNWQAKRAAPRRPAAATRSLPQTAPEPPFAAKVGAAAGRARREGPRRLGRAVGRARREGPRRLGRAVGRAGKTAGAAAPPPPTSRPAPPDPPDPPAPPPPPAG